MLHDGTPTYHGSATLHMQAHHRRRGMPRSGDEPASMMRGLGVQRMRLLLFGNDFGRLDDPTIPPNGRHWTGPDVPPRMGPLNARSGVGVAPRRRLASRALYPEPGPEIVVAWGDARDLLNCRFAHPERLHDSQKLRCHAQVYEALAPQPCEMLAMAMLGDVSLASQLHLLTDGLAAKLGLAAAPPPRPAFASQQRQHGMILAGDRLIRLLVSSDPTRDDESSVVAQTRDHPARGEQPATQAYATSPQPAGARARAPAIPEQYLRPWEFRRSRDEAIYEMHEAARRGRLRRLLRSLRYFRQSRREVFRWQIMIFGKTVDEKLWGVRPPVCGLEDAKLRDWAARTLAQAGYDPAFMLAEWEIYWRRKAL